MTDNGEIDVTELRAELDQIKDAIGLQDRYSDVPRKWLLYASVVVVAAGASQLVVLERSSAWLHAPIWFLAIGTASVVDRQWFGSGDQYGTAGGKPSPAILFAVVLALVVPIQLVFTPLFGGAEYLQTTSIVLGSIVVMIGAAYLLMGNLLRAYYIRRQDRIALYVGGLVMLPLGVAIPNVEVLHTWGFSAFGVVYALYAVLAYVTLTRGWEPS